MNTLKYNGYVGIFEYDEEAELFHGRVAHLRDVVTFEGHSVEELKAALRDSVEDYLTYCADRGEEPQRPYPGQFLVRVSPDEHRQIAEAAQVAGESVNKWAARVLLAASAGGIPVAAELSRGSGRGDPVFKRIGPEDADEAFLPEHTGEFAGLRLVVVEEPLGGRPVHTSRIKRSSHGKASHYIVKASING